ncbi:MAG: transglutaminase-like domain-containing protein [Bacteroidales bacterium]|jgi:hypothetical protein|nr:transglutaminase-like domain-containing protein [Bacteroidales bacterium]
MEISTKKVPKEDKTTNEKNLRSIFGDFLISFIITPLTCLPIFIFLHKILPNFDWFFNLDRILLFLIIFSLLEFFFNLFRKIAIWFFVIVLGVIIIGSVRGKYGFYDVYCGYRNMIVAIIDEPQGKVFDLKNIIPNPQKQEVINAVNFSNDTVRNFAIVIAGKHFKESKNKNYYSDYRNLIQCFSIFKEINSNWNYVNDPRSREYFAKASETVNNYKEDSNNYFSGDCDDHAILMVACITAIGGTARLVWTDGHIYPELLIGDNSDFEDIAYLIRRELFSNEISKAKDKNLYYHIEKDGKIWLNLDYTEHFPGGKFLNDGVLDTFEP